MTPERWGRVRELFDAVVEIESAQRTAFLDAHTQDDPQLRAEVERLLAADSDLQRSPRFQDAPVSPEEDDTRTSAGGRIAGENETIAGYRVLGKLGSGGMGVVYRAEQPHPRRQVALKLVRSDRVSPENLRRFSVETEVLGRLSHPNIAAIYDAGLHTDEDGAQRPYIVMELVAGRPLTEYVEAVRPTLRRRVELLVRVCDGLQHAHQNGIVHRDLKPGNILVDAEGNPKLVDFGIARPLFGELNVTLPETTPGEFIGTLAYMSPERLHGSSGPIDTRADVYSLGVVAYQTIAERMPLDLHGQVIAEVIRRIRDQQPRPLTFQGKPVDGDLQAVVRMALERDPADRYASAAALGDDLRRFLAGEPVIARPPSLWRHLRSFVRRHRAAAAAIAAVVVVSIAAAITSTGFAISANRARAAAQLESEMRAAVNDFLLGAMFDWGDPEYAAGRRVTVLEVLDRAAERIARIENPQVRAEVLYALSVIYQAQGAVPRGPHDKRPAAHELALQLAREALETWRVLSPVNELDVARGWHNLAHCLQDDAQYDEARHAAVQALGIHDRVLGADNPTTLKTRLTLATIALQQGDYDETEEIVARVLARVTIESQPRIAADALLLRADAAFRRGEIDAARRDYEAVLRVCRERLPGAYALLASDLSKLSEIFAKAGDFERARERLEEAERVRSEIFPAGHPARGAAALSSASLCYYSKQYDEGLAAVRRALDEYHVAYGGSPHRYIGQAHMWAAVIHRARGDAAAAVAAADRALEQFHATLASDDALTLRMRQLRCGALLDQNRCDEARGDLEDVYAAQTRATTPNDAACCATIDLLVRACECLEDAAGADEWRRRRAERCAAASGD